MLWRKILIAVLVLVALGTLIFTLGFKNGSEDGICKGAAVKIHDIGGNNFITEKDVFLLLNQNSLNPVNKEIRSVKLDKIRAIIEEFAGVKSAKVYFTKSDKLNIEIYQREPVFKIINNDDYFVDTERVLVPNNIDFCLYLPVVSGTVTKTFATNELFDFVSFIEKDKFLSALVQQIYVTPVQEVQLVPEVGNQTIIVGKIVKKEGRYDFEKKFNRLKKFYASDALNKLGWDTYSTIDLRYDKQVVCKKIEK